MFHALVLYWWSVWTVADVKLFRLPLFVIDSFLLKTLLMSKTPYTSPFSYYK